MGKIELILILFHGKELQLDFRWLRFKNKLIHSEALSKESCELLLLASQKFISLALNFIGSVTEYLWYTALAPNYK